MNFSRMALAVALLSLALFVAGSAPQANSAHDPQELLRLERHMFDAIRNKDGAAAAKLLADDFILRIPGESTLDKASFVKGIQTLPVQISQVWSDDLLVHFYGDTAVVSGRQLSRVRLAPDQEITVTQAFADVFARRKGRWLMVFAHSVEVPSAKKP